MFNVYVIQVKNISDYKTVKNENQASDTQMETERGMTASTTAGIVKDDSIL